MSADNLLTKAFWQDSLERAIKTIAQTALALLTVAGTTAFNIDYKQLLGACLLAGGISVLTSLVSAQATGTATASMLK